MSNSLKWLLALFVAAGLFVVARAATQETYYLPIVYRQPTLTPTITQTATVTPTVTHTPTRTTTVTRTPTETPRLFMEIVRIVYNPPNPLDDYVEIRNNGTPSVDMQDWTLKDLITNVYKFPDFTLRSGASVRVRDRPNKTTCMYKGLPRFVFRGDKCLVASEEFCFSGKIHFQPQPYRQQ